MKTKILTILIIGAGMVFATTAIALNPPPQQGGQFGAPQPIQSNQTMTTLVMTLTEILAWVYTIFFIIAAFFILYAAFTYLTAKGDPEKVTGARDQIIYAVIAIVVALLAFSIDQIVSSIVI